MNGKNLFFVGEKLKLLSFLAVSYTPLEKPRERQLFAQILICGFR